MISNSYFEVIAIKDHKPIHVQSQLAFKKGQRFIVVETAPTGWWRGEFNGKSGLFPQSYVNKVEVEDITESPELTAINNNNNNTNIEPKQQLVQRQNSPPSSLLPPPPLTSLISVTNLNINDIKIEEVINNLPPPPNNIQKDNNNNKPPAKILPPPIVNNNNISFSPIIKQQTPSNSLQLPTTNNNTNTNTTSQPKSPRFNIPVIQSSVQQQPLGLIRPQSPAVVKTSSGNTSPIYNTITGTRSHSRKNSGPSTSVDEASDEIENTNSNSYSSQSTNNNTTTLKQRQDTNVTSQSPTNIVTGSNPDKFKTLPSNINKTRTPIFNSDRIGMKDINPEVPYYIVRAMEPFVKHAFDELEVATGDLIVVYNHKDVKSDWWVGKIKSNFGIFPKNCVEIIKDISPNPSVLSPPLSSQQASQQSNKPVVQPPPPILTTNSSNSTAEPTYRKGLAMTSYNSQFANYLSFKKGDEIVLIKKEGEFWKGRIGNHIGLVSSNYISEISLPNATLPTFNQQQPPVQTKINGISPNTIQSPIVNKPNTISNSNNSSSNNTPVLNSTNSSSSGSSNSSLNITSPSSTTEPDDDSVAQKIRDSMSQFETRDELLTAIQNLAIKFVKQTGLLKKELNEEKNQRVKLENEIKLLESELDLLKSLQ